VNILTTIRNIFSKTQPSVTQPIISLDLRAYIAKHKKEIEEEAKILIDKCCSDFDVFFWRQHFDVFLRTEILPFRQPDSKRNGILANSYWETKHPFNFPGPFYTGESDTCATGDIEAPNNVMYDENTKEFIFRQPQSFEDLVGVVDAAAVEVFGSYSCDGNIFWTYSKCKEWWQNRFDYIFEMNKADAKKVNGDRFVLFENYLKGTAEIDLKKYCYFLENGNYPKLDIASLPPLD